MPEPSPALGRLVAHENNASDLLTFLFERDPRPLITLLGLADDRYRCQREVKVKGGRLDLVVYRQPSNQPVAMLELKGASSKHDDQLDRYQAWAQKLDPAPKLFYCTLDGDDAPPIPWQPLSLATLFGAWQAVKDPHTAWLAHEITDVLRHWDAEAEGVIGAARGWYVPDLITRRTARALDELLRSAHPSDGEASASRTNTGNPMLTAWRRHPNGSDHARIAVDVRCNGRATPARPWLFRPCVDVSSAGRSEQAALIEAHDLAVTLQPAMLLPAIRDALTRREHPKLAEALRAEDHGGLAGPADPVVLANWRARLAAGDQTPRRHPVFLHDRGTKEGELMRTQPKIIFDMFEGYAPVKNLLGMADPNVHKIDGQWWMLFGAMQRNFTNNLFWATLPKGEPLNADMQWQITMDPTNPKKAQSLIRQPSKGEWDHFGLHEPCFVEGKKRDDAGKWVPSRRIYYTGRTGRSLFGKNTKYSIGLLELTANGWQRHGAPVIISDVLSHCALAPKVIYDDDEEKWRIWYLADAREPVKGDKDAADIYYSESDDGIIWQAPKSFFGNEYKFTHAHVHRRGDGTYEMLLSKMASFSGEASYHEHKLWISTAETPSGNRADWSELQEVIAAKGGKVWYANGFFGSSVCEADAKGEEGEHYIFFTGIRGSFNWLKLAVKRLLKLKKPPNLAPFYFAIGFFKIW